MKGRKHPAFFYTPISQDDRTEPDMEMKCITYEHKSFRNTLYLNRIKGVTHKDEQDRLLP